MTKCKWEQDEVCVNADCPLCADYCPVIDTPGVCKHEDRGQEKQKESICGDCANSSASVTDDFADCLCKKRGGIVGGVTECKDYRYWKEVSDNG